ncbi:MAG: Na+/H+ antiporter subunit A [Demequina sp.]|uniref:Na+/H+ antiporter subunit A n=1 Tax=Demequina sp. TaxID=2050685 RepID=UPI003A885DBB
MIVLLAMFGALALATPLLVKVMGRWAFAVLAAMPGAAAIWTALQAPAALGDHPPTVSVEWIPVLGMDLSFRMDALAWVMAMLVLIVGALVLLYCTWYFSDDEPGLGRFAAFLLAFAGVMFGLVTADDIIVMFIFWEATSVLSYLLIGHYTARRESRGAALQALLVTTTGGLAMFVGIVILVAQTGTTSLTQIVASPPSLTDPLTISTVMLVLAGAVSKSALVPFHFWLPAAMAAPTPVSAYLHAAAMVKAGIYLIARFAPGFADVPGWRGVLVTLGVATMLVGGWRSLRQTDLKLLLAYGTISQLGFLTLVLAFGEPNIALAGLTLLVGHAAFKATLFLTVGIIDHDAGTRDLRELSGIGRARPALAVIAILAAASMAGIPPLLGFVAKEAVLTSLIEQLALTPLWGWVALVGAVVGSIFTVAYSARFVWGAFASKPKVASTKIHRSSAAILVAPALLSVFGVATGLAPRILEPYLEPYAESYGEEPTYHLALWHGFEPALWLTIAVIVVGTAMFVWRGPLLRMQGRLPRVPDASRGYTASIRAINWAGLVTSRALQRRGLPGYLAMILGVFVFSVVASAIAGADLVGSIVPWDYPTQAVVAAFMIVAAIASAMVRQRFTAVLLVGMVGYGMVALFGMHGAPDLALTQALVETVTLVVFVLVLRRLPHRIAERNVPRRRLLRAGIGIAVGLAMALVAVVALGSRTADSISAELPEMALNEGHGQNVVNVLLVDIRAWDTMGEISMLVAVATGVASLLFVTGREGSEERLARPGSGISLRRRAATAEVVTEPAVPDAVTSIETASFSVVGESPADFSAGENKAPTRRSWLLAGRTLSASNRSILLEVLVRFLFHPAMVVSVYLLFAGHNAPGGGFAGGLLAGLALLARYLAGGRYELGEAAPIDAGKLLGTGILFAAGTAAGALAFGMEVLESTWFEYSWGPLHLSAGTSTLFDIGVYLVVLGVSLDILRSLGAQVDRHQQDRDSTEEEARA